MSSHDPIHKEGAPTLSPDDARQGERRGIVSKILTISTALVVAAFLIVYFVFFFD